MKSTIQKKVYYHDTDCAGVVYYANYLKYFEEARTEYFRSKGITLDKLSREGIFFVVANVEIKYRRAARYQDELVISSQIEKIKAASLEFYHRVKKNQSLLVECRTKLACVDQDFNPQAIPQHISALL
jgi:acyl-CoA thioester hydrolase